MKGSVKFHKIDVKIGFYVKLKMNTFVSKLNQHSIFFYQPRLII